MMTLKSSGHELFVQEVQSQETLIYVHEEFKESPTSISTRT
jgi:hypothetical protein